MKIINCLICILPWKIKRLLLTHFYGYKIDKSAKIGLSYIYPKSLEMGPNTVIRNFCVCIHIDLLKMDNNSRIGRGNWITGFPTNSKSDFFSHQQNRKAELLVGNNTLILRNHHFDCTNQIKIGSFTTIAGYNSQFLTHSINIHKNIQDSMPIEIGDYCFIGTRNIFLGGSIIPSKSVTAAGAVVTKDLSSAESYSLFGGVPAKFIKRLSTEDLYFQRTKGDVK